MIVLGIDPGLATVGYGVVSCDEKTRLELIDYGTILTEAGEQFPIRLKQISHGISQLYEIDVYKRQIELFMGGMNVVNGRYLYGPLSNLRSTTKLA